MRSSCTEPSCLHPNHCDHERLTEKSCRDELRKMGYVIKTLPRKSRVKYVIRPRRRPKDLGFWTSDLNEAVRHMRHWRNVVRECRENNP